MYSTKLSASIHLLSVVALMKDQPVTSQYIASSINTNPALVRRLMSRLKKAQLIKTQTKLGVTGLLKEPQDISLLDIFLAVEDQQEMFSIHPHPNHSCPVGAKIEMTLKRLYTAIQDSTESYLAEITLADIIEDFS
ncbi:putative HTH-type transcriptional regulator YwnA [bioreactor metagenome]|uniref:Putative HTH-type transcriptional regulator YwnA n=1 Tax=bioreactor metagenome TaxID=1076179 RepID=A0A645A534_9ZZZZ